MMKEDLRSLSTSLEELERIPVNNRGKITEDDYKAMQLYLTKVNIQSFYNSNALTYVCL